MVVILGYNAVIFNHDTSNDNKTFRLDCRTKKIERTDAERI